MQKHSSYREPIGPSGKPRPIPARTVTISQLAKHATEEAIMELVYASLTVTPAQRLRIESIIQSVLDEQQNMGLTSGTQ